MEDRFTRRGFVGALALGASALWLPRARAVDRLRLHARWEARWQDEDLRVTLHLRHDDPTMHVAPPGAIELVATLTGNGRPRRFDIEPIPLMRGDRRTRSGRRIVRRVFVGNEEVPYDTYVTTVSERRERTSLQIRPRLRGALTDYPEESQAIVAALAALDETTVSVQQA